MLALAVGPLSCADSSGEGAASDVDITVINAVAPYDAESARDRFRLFDAIGAWEATLLDHCEQPSQWGGQDAAPLGSGESPEGRDVRLFAHNLDYPYTEGLKAEGFVNEIASPDSPNVEEGAEVDEDEWDEWMECTASVPDDVVESVGATRDSFYDLISAWNQVEADVDKHADIDAGVDHFRECLVNEGVPPDAAETPEAFLASHVDVAIFEEQDPDEYEALYVEYGKLYGECGEPLFSVREELRAGEARVEFIDAYREEIEIFDERLREEGVLDELV